MARFILIVSMIVLHGDLLSQTVVTLRREINIDAQKNTRKFTYTGFLPQDILDKQRVIDIRYYPKEPETFTLDGSKYYKFDLSRSEADRDSRIIRIIVEYDLELFDYDLNKAKFYKNGIEDTLQIEQYLDTDRYKYSIRKIQKRIEGQIDETGNDLIKAKSIFDFVLNTLEFDSSISYTLPPSESLDLGKGDCTEYGDLFVAICRLKGIPAKLTGGTVGSIPHLWTEIYLKEYGWVPIDPSLADRSEDVTFDDLRHNYIYISSERSGLLSGVQANFNNQLWEDAMSFSPSKGIYTSNRKYMELMKDAAKYFNNDQLDSASILLDKLLSFDVMNIKYLTFKGNTLARQGKFDEASVLFQAAFRFATHHQQKQEVYYAYSNYLSLKNDVDNALKYLRSSLELGFQNFDHIRTDVDLENLKTTEGFKKLMAEFDPLLVNDLESAK